MCLLLVTLIAFSWSFAVTGDKYPSREVDLMIPWSSGGATDSVFRTFPDHPYSMPLRRLLLHQQYI